MVNGSDERIVKTAKVFTMDELMRLPSVSRFHFIECGANTGMEWGNVAVPTCQYTHGMLSCSEFTGVPLKLLLDMAGVDYKRGRFVLGEGADGSSMTRTVPMELVESGEVIVAYGQNGEMLRPENGYPLRLVVPGVQGVSWVKYLRRIEVGDKPYGAKDEVMHYLDLMPGGLHRQYTSIQECKSVVTTPSGGQVLLDKGFYNITGLAWSGRGKIKRVDVSVDGGRNWRHGRDRVCAAELQAAARGSRHALDLSQQRHPDLAGAGKWRGEECAAGVRSAWSRSPPSRCASRRQRMRSRRPIPASGGRPARTR
jgi:sulfane dehydrogenase subunit SoxC